MWSSPGAWICRQALGMLTGASAWQLMKLKRSRSLSSTPAEIFVTWTQCAPSAWHSWYVQPSMDDVWQLQHDFTPQPCCSKLSHVFS